MSRPNSHGYVNPCRGYVPSKSPLSYVLAARSNNCMKERFIFDFNIN